MFNESCSKVLLIVFNVVFLVAGLGLLGVGVYVRVSKTEYEDLLGSSMLPLATYFMIGAGGLVAFVSLAGCVGALTKNRKLLTVYMVFLVLVFLLEAAGGIIGFMYHQKVREVLDEYVKTAILNKYGYGEFQLVSLAINVMQQKLKCCGYLSPRDWTMSAYYTDPNATIIADRGATKMPISCCKDINQVGCNNKFDYPVFSQGCLVQLEILIKQNLNMVGAASLSLAVVQLVGFVLSVSLCKDAEDKMHV